MTRDKAERAYNRIMDYTIETKGDFAAQCMNDNEYKEAIIRTMEQLELEDLDMKSTIWFIDDSYEYKKAYDTLIEDHRKLEKVCGLLSKNLSEIMEENED